jgi:hypothetical protein
MTLIGAIALWCLPEIETDGKLAHLVAVDDGQYSGRIVGNPSLIALRQSCPSLAHYL